MGEGWGCGGHVQNYSLLKRNVGWCLLLEDLEDRERNTGKMKDDKLKEGALIQAFAVELVKITRLGFCKSAS